MSMIQPTNHLSQVHRLCFQPYHTICKCDTYKMCTKSNEESQFLNVHNNGPKTV